MIFVEFPISRRALATSRYAASGESLRRVYGGRL